MRAEFISGQEVNTPNGFGVVQGYYEGGMVLVRHMCNKMTGISGGECITPKGILSTLYIYQPADLKSVRSK